MHELSIIQSILEATAQAVAQSGHSGSVQSVELEIGELAGIEWSTLEFLWPAAVGDTLLADAALRIRRVPGKALCSDCMISFHVQHLYEPCPGCGSHFLQITQGEELRIKSLTLADKPAPARAPLNWN